MAVDKLRVDSLNRYLYTVNNPVNFVDPSGLEVIIDDANGITADDYKAWKEDYSTEITNQNNQVQTVNAVNQHSKASLITPPLEYTDPVAYRNLNVPETATIAPTVTVPELTSEVIKEEVVYKDDVAFRMGGQSSNVTLEECGEQSDLSYYQENSPIMEGMGEVLHGDPIWIWLFDSVGLVPDSFKEERAAHYKNHEDEREIGILLGTMLVTQAATITPPPIPEGTSELVLKGTKYSPEYAQKLQNTYKVFKDNGYDIGEHGLNRIFGRINQGKIKSVEQVFDVLETGTKYSDTINGGSVLYKNGVSIHIAEDGFIKSVIGNAKVKETWELLK